jgi:UDP-glucose 4-epimerase
MRRILVTGNKGLLGRTLIKYLDSSDDFIPVLFHSNNEYMDIRNEKHCSKALNGVQGVIHLASLQEYKRAKEKDINEVNVSGTAILRRIALDKGVSSFIFPSTQNVYTLNSLPSGGFSEESPLNPATPYAKSKFFAEKVLGSMPNNGLCIFRISVIASDIASPQSFLRYFVDSIRYKQHINIFGSGERVYDFVSAEDVCLFFLAALRKNLEGIFNLGCGTRTTVTDMINSLPKSLKFTIEKYPQIKEHPSCFLNCKKIDSHIKIQRRSMSCILNRLITGNEDVD